MSKNLIKPVENGDFWEAQNPECDLRLALLSDPDGAGITPPPLFAMAAEPENGQNPAQHIERGGLLTIPVMYTSFIFRPES